MRSYTDNGISALFTDFYELTMAQGYWKKKMDEPAVFDMFFRKQPFKGGFSVFAGIAPLLEALAAFRFTDEDIAYLDGLDVFEQGFLDYLKNFSFRGDVYAMDEGSVIFPNEPLVRIHADLIGAQIVEGLVLNYINFQSLIATKTARVLLASQKGNIMEFGLRRAQGQDGAMSASRAAYIGGASATSNALAAKLYHIPVQGTMAHSWIMSFPTELEAFEAYADIYPDTSVFLIDTYDTLNSGIKNAITVGKKLAAQGKRFGVRLDSGDIQYLSKEVRRKLDEAGCADARISVSNELTEHIIEALVQEGTPIDNWGVGTHMVTGGDESSFTGVYKLAARRDRAQDRMISSMKFSDNPEKTTNPGLKEVWRLYDPDGMAKADILALSHEEIEENVQRRFYHPSVDYRQFSFVPAKAVRLLKKKMEAGKLIPEQAADPALLLTEARSLMLRQLDTFDATYKRMLNPHIYKVSITEELKNLKLEFIRARIR